MIGLKKNQSKKDLAKSNNKGLMSETLLENDSPELQLAEKLKEKKKVLKKKKNKRIRRISGTVFLVLFLWWGFAPFSATIPYGLCKLLIEQSVTYPPTLNFTEVATLRNGDVRIWFTHTDAFGAFRMESFICSYAFNEKTGSSYVSKARWGQVEINQKTLDNFNKVLPYLVAGEYYDLTYPAALPDSLEDLKLETDRFRKANIMDLVKAR